MLKCYILNVFNLFDVVTLQPQGFQSYVFLQALYGMEAFMMQIQDCVEPWMGFCEKKSLNSLRFSLTRETDTKNSWAILQNFNSWMIKLTVIKKEAIWNLAVWQNCSFGQFYHSITELFCFKFLSSEKISENWEIFFTKSQPKCCMIEFCSIGDGKWPLVTKSSGLWASSANWATMGRLMLWTPALCEQK